jgi:hypothetical protein
MAVAKIFPDPKPIVEAAASVPPKEVASVPPKEVAVPSSEEKPVDPRPVGRVRKPVEDE